MIPEPHRLKGGAVQLGADQPGRPGPFGIWSDQGSQGDDYGPEYHPALHTTWP